MVVPSHEQARKPPMGKHSGARQVNMVRGEREQPAVEASAIEAPALVEHSTRHHRTRCGVGCGVEGTRESLLERGASAPVQAAEKGLKTASALTTCVSADPLSNPASPPTSPEER